MYDAPHAAAMKHLMTTHHQVVQWCQLLSWVRAEKELRAAIETGAIDEDTVSLGQALISKNESVFIGLASLLERKKLPDLQIIPPPKRSLVGYTGELELTISLDNGVDRGFSLFLIQSRRKLGYVLCRIEEPSDLVIRGAAVTDSARGSGIAKDLLSVVLALGQALALSKTRTESIDKPLLALSLQSAGFIPDNTSCQVLVAPDPRATFADACLVWPDPESKFGSSEANSHLDDLSLWNKRLISLRSVFSNKLRKTQRIRIASPSEDPPKTAKLVAVRTCFSFSSSKTAVSDTKQKPICFRSARLLAMLGSILPSSSFYQPDID